MKYSKVPFTSEEHISTLESRGLTITDKERAKKYLSNVGYYRLTGYMYHLQSKDGKHDFQKGTSFNDIIKHYQFDKKLRILVLTYIERIEVALRAKLNDKYSLNHSFFWYTKYDLYEDKNLYNSTNEYIRNYFENPQENFLKAYKFKYSSEQLPPSNMAMETLTFGKLSRLYKGLKNDIEKQEIASDFGLPSTILSSWFIYINNVRNICAHHSRLWNKRITADRPTIPTRKKLQFNGDIPPNFNTTVYGVVSIIDRLLKNINPSNSFIDKITDLINEYPTINLNYMGFPENWKKEPAWK